MPLLSAYSPIAPLFLPLAPPLPRRPSLAFRLEPRLPHRLRLTDPAPFPDDGPVIEQGPGHGDSVEPHPVAGRLAPFQASRLGYFAVTQCTQNRINGLLGPS